MFMPMSRMALFRAAVCSSDIWVRGRRIMPVSMSMNLMAVFMGMGLVSMKRAEKSRAYFPYSSAAAL